jgi:hypothetical protein
MYLSFFPKCNCGHNRDNCLIPLDLSQCRLLRDLNGYIEPVPGDKNLPDTKWICNGSEKDVHAGDAENYRTLRNRSKACALRWKLMWFPFAAINENDFEAAPRKNRLFEFP